MAKRINQRLASALLAASILFTMSSCSSKNNNKDNKNNDDNLDRNVEDNIVDDSNKTEENNTIIEISRFAYLTCDTPLYNEKAEEIDYINKYQKISIVGEYNTYTEICYYKSENDVVHGYIPIDIYEKLPSVFVEVDISDKIVNVYKDNDDYCLAKAETSEDVQNREGYFDVEYKEFDTYLGDVHTDFWVQLNNDTGFCNASYDENRKDNIYLSYESAKEVYERVNPGTKVLIHK